MESARSLGRIFINLLLKGGLGYEDKLRLYPFRMSTVGFDRLFDLPYSAKWPRIALMSCVRWRTTRTRVRNASPAACCASVFTATKRMPGRCAASQIASASIASFLCLFMNGLT